MPESFRDLLQRLIESVVPEVRAADAAPGAEPGPPAVPEEIDLRTVAKSAVEPSSLDRVSDSDSSTPADGPQLTAKQPSFPGDAQPSHAVTPAEHKPSSPPTDDNSQPNQPFPVETPPRIPERSAGLTSAPSVERAFSEIEHKPATATRSTAPFEFIPPAIADLAAQLETPEPYAAAMSRAAPIRIPSQTTAPDDSETTDSQVVDLIGNIDRHLQTAQDEQLRTLERLEELFRGTLASQQELSRFADRLDQLETGHLLRGRL